jgi:hypothetical protein
MRERIRDFYSSASAHNSRASLAHCGNKVAAFRSEESAALAALL